MQVSGYTTAHGQVGACGDAGKSAGERDCGAAGENGESVVYSVRSGHGMTRAAHSTCTRELSRGEKVERMCQDNEML